MTALTLWRATRFWQRLMGLHAYLPLAPATGLWITPCCAVHTLGMAYAIDVLYLDAHGHIIRRVDGMAPNRLSVCWAACSVVELPAGYCAQHPDYAAQVTGALEAIRTVQGRPHGFKG